MAKHVNRVDSQVEIRQIDFEECRCDTAVIELLGFAEVVVRLLLMSFLAVIKWAEECLVEKAKQLKWSKGNAKGKEKGREDEEWQVSKDDLMERCDYLEQVDDLIGCREEVAKL